MPELPRLAQPPLPPPEVPAGEARAAAREILSRAEYRQPGPSPLERAWDWLTGQLADLLAGVGGGAGGFWFGMALLAVALGITGWLLVRVLPRGRRRRRPAPPAVGVEVGAGRPDRRQLLALAAAAEADGRWAEAVAHRYRALVLGLAERRALPDDPAATTGELRRSLDATGDDRASFDAASTRFEEVRYGGSAAGPEDGRRLAGWDRQLVGGGR